MAQDKEMESIIKAIRSGLKKYTKDFDEASERFLKRKQIEYGPKIEYVLQIVSSEYCIKKQQLIHSDARGHIQDAKRMAYCLLHFKVELPVRHISKRIFFNSHQTIFNAIKSFKTLNEKVKTDKEFKERYDKLEKKIAHL